MRGAAIASQHPSRIGERDVTEIARSGPVGRAATRDAIALRGQPAPAKAAPLPLASVAIQGWRALAERAIEPNGFYLPSWALAAEAFARDRSGQLALTAWSDAADGGRLIGLLPVIPLWRACRIPLPALASADAYGTLCTPLLDREIAPVAVQELMREARNSGARALILRDVALDGAAMTIFNHVLAADGMRASVLQSHARACLDATRDAEPLLREALGVKKLKELRRQRQRL